MTVHIDHAAVVTARMPTSDECAHGFPDGVPVLVVDDGVMDKVFPHWVAVTFDDPHVRAEPDAVQDAAIYVLKMIGEQMELVGGRVTDLASAIRRSPCSVTHLADVMREEDEAPGHSTNASFVTSVAGVADSAT